MTTGPLLPDSKSSTNQSWHNVVLIETMRNEVVKQQLSTELELARIEDEYRRRACGNIYAERYSYFNESTLLHAQSLKRNVLALLKRHEFTNLDEKKILDVGCGNGTQLCRFLDYNALPASLSGIDLMAPRIELAHRLHPGIERQLFRRPGAKFDFRRIIMAPPISRIVALLAYWMAYALEQLKILNTHTIAIISLD
jgi:SAM-dependent methyltransferase